MARRISETIYVGCKHTSVACNRNTKSTTAAWWIMWVAVALKCQPLSKRAATNSPFVVAWSSSSSSLSSSYWNHRHLRFTTVRERRHERRFVSSSSLPTTRQSSSSKKDMARTNFPSTSSLFLSSSTSASSSKQEDNISTEFLAKNWREDPRINPTLTIPTVLIPSQEMHRWMNDHRLQNHKLSLDSHPLLPHIHPRIKLVQDFEYPASSPSSDDDKDASSHSKKRILLSPETTLEDLKDLELEWGPPYEMTISYKQLSFSYILNQLIPKQYSSSSSSSSPSQNDEDFDYESNDQCNPTTTNITNGSSNKELILLPPPSAYEQIGHIAHFNLKPYHIPYGKLIGEVLLETNPNIKIVVNKVGQVKGKYRTYDYQILSSSSSSSSKFDDSNHNGNNSKEQRKQHPSLLETTVSEHGISIQVDIADCYWCTRLSGERQELLRDILSSPNGNENKETTDLVIADIFCGVGAQLLLLAKSNRRCQIKANDWNPAAIRCLKSSIVKNNLNPSQFELSQKDAYDFLMDLGCAPSSASSSTQTSKARRTSRSRREETKHSDSNDIPEKQNWSLPDHILMNYPLEGPTFLGALRWWPSSNVDEHYKQTGRYPRFHIYTFASRRTTSSTKKHNDLQAEENAVDVIANELLPWSTSVIEESELLRNEDLQLDGPSHVSIRSTSRDELNQEFDANVQTRMVRDVAPGKVVVLVSFSLTSKLVRYMQGSFSD